MCLIVFAWKAHPRYPLILATNRDEYHERPSAPLSYWDDAPEVLGGRDIEKGITADYLSLLDTFYEEWMETFDLCPVLTIPTENLDFVNKPKHLDIVVERILDKLAGKEDVIFPPNGA